MRDLAALTDKQTSAINELDLALTMYREAITNRLLAEQNERAERKSLFDLAYRIAGTE